MIRDMGEAVGGRECWASAGRGEGRGVASEVPCVRANSWSGVLGGVLRGWVYCRECYGGGGE